MQQKIVKNKKVKAIQFKPYYSQEYGQAYLGDSLKLIEHISDNSINLILTSPPFALTRQKEYGNQREEDYIEWFLPFAKEFKRVLADNGSFVLDLGGAYRPGLPVRSLYQYELLLTLCKKLGFHLAQELYHYNPARLPTPAEWVTVRRIRVKDSVNVVWWLSKTPHPKADNTKVLKPYSKSMKNLLEKGYEAKLRPSGHDISDKFQKDNKGAIPPNFLEPQNFLKIGNTESNSAYMRRCKEAEIKPHPARFLSGFTEFFIKFLTDEHDIVLDPFAGSNTTGSVAETLQRRWMSFEINENYLIGSKYRFDDSNFK